MGLFHQSAPLDQAESVRNAFTLWRDTFFPYQQEIFFEESDFALWVKARQIGFSHSIAGDGVRRGILEGSTNLVLSASQDLADEVIAKAKAHAEVLYRLGVAAARPVSPTNASRVTFANGGRVIALPASKKTARSHAGNVYLDEFAYHDDPKGIWDAAAGQATRGKFKIRVISTPNGAQGMFNEWATNPPAGWTRHIVDIARAQREGMRVDLDRLWKLAGGDERIFAQWYRCIFLDAALQYIPTAMADRALHWLGDMPDLSTAEFHAGLDVGRNNDLTALVIVAVLGRYAFVLPPITCRRTRFRAQRKMIREARELFRWQSLHIDANGMGRDMAEELQELWGETEVKLLDFTMQDKEDMATRALRWFRDDRVRFPRDDEGTKLRAETIAVRRIVTPAGNITYDVPRTALGHGDRWWGMCLALKGAGEPLSPRGMGLEPLLAVA